MQTFLTPGMIALQQRILGFLKPGMEFEIDVVYLESIVNRENDAMETAEKKKVQKPISKMLPISVDELLSSYNIESEDKKPDAFTLFVEWLISIHCDLDISDYKPVAIITSTEVLINTVPGDTFDAMNMRMIKNRGTQYEYRRMYEYTERHR